MRIKLQLDLSAIVTLSLYSFCISLRTFQWVFFAFIGSGEHQSVIFGLLVLNTIAERIKWFIMYYFILEMQQVKIKLESNSIVQFDKMMLRHRLQKKLIFGLCILLSTATLTFNIVRHYNDTMADLNQHLALWISLVAFIFRSLKVTLDVYMFIMFMRVFLFFKNSKEDNLKKKGH